MCLRPTLTYTVFTLHQDPFIGVIGYFKFLALVSVSVSVSVKAPLDDCCSLHMITGNAFETKKIRQNFFVCQKVCKKKIQGDENSVSHVSFCLAAYPHSPASLVPITHNTVINLGLVGRLISMVHTEYPHCAEHAVCRVPTTCRVPSTYMPCPNVQCLSIIAGQVSSISESPHHSIQINRTRKCKEKKQPTGTSLRVGTNKLLL